MKKISLGLLIFFAILGAFSLAVKAQPVAPTDFTAAAVSSCAIRLEWTGETSQYQIERNGVVETSIPAKSGEKYFLIDSHDSNLWGTASEDPIDPGKKNSYRIRAYDSLAGQYSAWVGPVSATTDALPSKPGKPTNATSRVKDTGNIETSWATSSPISKLFKDYGGFEIWVATSADGQNYSEAVKIDRIPATSNRLRDGKYFYETGGNDKNLSYQYIFYAQEVGGFGCDFRRSAHVVVSDPSDTLTIPARPQNFNARFIENPRKIELTWTDIQKSPNETDFEIQRSLDSNFSSYITISLGADKTSYDDTNIAITGGETYYYRIRSCISSECSFWSPTVSATTGIPVPEKLEARIVYATMTQANNLISWDEEIILAGSTLELERATSDEQFTVIASLSPTSQARQGRSYSDENLTLGKTYIYRARVKKGEGSSDYSNKASVNLDIANILQGVAWADVPGDGTGAGIGWIKFNSESENNSAASAVKYSVQIDRNGLVTGNAWSEHYGWLSFHPPDLNGCPSATCQASLNADGKLSGWARFVGPKSFSQGTTAWDGWVHLSDNNYGVNFDSTTGKFSGEAWAGDIGGWIVFGPTTVNNKTYCQHCTVRASLVNRPPTVSNVKIEGPAESWCSATPFYRVTWTYTDPDNNIQKEFKIKFVNTQDNSVTFETQVTGTDGGQPSYRLNDPLNGPAWLKANTSYKAEVSASDGWVFSAWSASQATTTPTHYLPLVAFTMSPDPTATGTITAFTDISSDRSGGEYSLQSWKWTFQNAAPPTAEKVEAGQSVFVIFPQLPSRATLTVTDKSGASCTAEREVNSGGPAGPIKRRIFRER